jgi:chromosome partitioning protein
VIICFANEKGGVGKTTLAIHTATWLSRKGHRVALMDLDTQGGVSNFFHVEPTDDVAELLRSVLLAPATPRPPITKYLSALPLKRYRNMVLIKGYTGTGEVEAWLRQPNSPRPGEVLAEAVAPLTQRGAIVVVDSGPYAGKLQEAALDTADHVLVPAIPEGATEAGILKIAQRLHQLDRAITGLIPVRITVTSKKHRETIMDWREANGLGPLVYHDPPRGLVGLPQRVVWSQLYRAGKPVWDVSPREVEADHASLMVAQQEMEAILQRLAFDIGLSGR